MFGSGIESKRGRFRWHSRHRYPNLDPGIREQVFGTVEMGQAGQLGP